MNFGTYLKSNIFGQQNNYVIKYGKSVNVKTELTRYQTMKNKIMEKYLKF